MAARHNSELRLAHECPDVRRVRGDSTPLTTHDWKVIAGLPLVGLIAALPAAAYDQEFIAGMLLIEESVDRNLLGWLVPTSAFNLLDSFFCMLLLPPLALYSRGALGGWWQTMSHTNFFLLHAALAMGPFLLTLLTIRPLERLFAPRQWINGHGVLGSSFPSC